MALKWWPVVLAGLVLLAVCVIAASLLPMAIWGGDTVKPFAWPMLFGVIVATTSSIYIGGPILLFLNRYWKDRSATRTAGTPAAEA